MQHPQILIVMPVFNDWIACATLIQDLHEVAHSENWKAKILVIDDGSNVAGPDHQNWETSCHPIDILRLKRNLGHQRAICIGLAFACDHWTGDCVVVMDGDGQDGATDIPALLNIALTDPNSPVVFAERQRRPENLLFKVGYAMYKACHLFLTGHQVRVGNFSAIPFARAKTLCVFSELWNHYAATVFKSKLPRRQIPIDRRGRTDGSSRMNLVGLVVHGLSAMSVFGETIGVRLLILTGILGVLSFIAGVTVLAIRLFTDLAIPGWATYALIGSAIVGIQAVLLMLVFVFVVLSGRNGSVFLPSRDYHAFIERIEPWKQ